MPVLPLPLGTGVYKNVDQSEVSDKDLEIVDAYCDEEGAIVKRPGASSLIDLSGYNGASALTPVEGLFWWQQKERLIALIEGELTFTTKSGSVYTTTAIGNSAQKLPTGVRPMFASDATYLLVAAGGKMIYTSAAANQQWVSDADAPTLVTHVANLDGYFLANSVGTPRFYFSALNDPTTWSALDFASAVGDADYVNAIHTLRRELYLFGANSIEIWQNDGSTPFSRLDSGFIESGTISPYSIVKTEDNLYWLDDRRRFVTFEGARVSEIRSPYSKVIDSFQDVRDCTSDRIKIGGQDFLIWAFKSENKTFVLNLMNNKWSEWGDYDNNGETYNRWLYNCYAYAKTWGQHVVGRRNAPQVDLLSPTVYTDGDSSRIRTYHKTGHIDHGSLRRKRCNRLMLRVKTGHPGTTTTPQLMVRFRDDDKPGWSNSKLISLRDQGDSNLYGELKMLGIYRTRQWEFSCSDSVPLSYVKAEVDVDLLGL